MKAPPGRGGQDGYIHIEDARDILRMDEMEISEIALRLHNFSKLHYVNAAVQEKLSSQNNPNGQPPFFEVHTWEKLSPFFNIARMIDIMTFFIKFMLIAIVLISIMNVMIMAVYERIKEIGTIAAIGTKPEKILSMFIIEGLLLGVFGTCGGVILGTASIFILNTMKLSFNFARQTGLILSPSIKIWDIGVISAIVIVASILASFQPAFKASRMEPIEALRHV